MYVVLVQVWRKSVAYLSSVYLSVRLWIFVQKVAWLVCGLVIVFSETGWKIAKYFILYQINSLLAALLITALWKIIIFEKFFHRPQ